MTHVEWDWQTPVWGPYVEALSRHRRFVRYDPRGCGLSDREVAGEITLDALVSDMECVVDAAGLDRFSLMGSSQGGAVSLAYTARHPERVTQLVLLDAFVRGTVVRQQAAQKQVDAMCALVAEGWTQDNPAFRQMFTSQFFPCGTREQMDSFNELQRKCTSAEHAVRLVRAFSMLDARASLGLVRCPTLVMHCRGDARVPYEEGRFIAAGIAGAHLEPLDSGNHVPLEGEPAFERMMELIDAFLPAVGSSAPAFAGLSMRERELLELLARGLDNAQIAAHLDLAEKTVRNRVSALFDALGVENRSQAIVHARDAGFGRGT
jgi:pimeloyl-ACP methyl ester carboxylesterase/DNA-binding CsgD family transcriptional regulator